jgi:hypothetical protein
MFMTVYLAHTKVLEAKQGINHKDFVDDDLEVRFSFDSPINRIVHAHPEVSSSHVGRLTSCECDIIIPALNHIIHFN